MTTPDLTPERLAAIRARAEAATEGPWEIGVLEYGIAISVDGKSFIAVWPKSLDDTEFPVESNADFIAHARTDIPDLLAAIEARDAEITRLVDEVEKCHHYAQSGKTNTGAVCGIAGRALERHGRLGPDSLKVHGAVFAKESEK